MGDDDRQNREGEDRQLVAMPYLFGYQKDHSGAKKQQRDQPLVMLAETMPERPRADGERYESQIAYVKDRPGHDRRYAIDARKIERELGWKPAETFETGIRKTVEWYLAHGEWVDAVTSGAYREWIDRQYRKPTVQDTAIA